MSPLARMADSSTALNMRVAMRMLNSLTIRTATSTELSGSAKMLTTGRAIRIITADTTTESPMASGNRYRMMGVPSPTRPVPDARQQNTAGTAHAVGDGVGNHADLIGHLIGLQHGGAQHAERLQVHGVAQTEHDLVA